MSRTFALLAVAATSLLASGCAVVTVASVAVGTVATVGGLAVDGVVTTAKVAGKVVGKTVDLVTPASPPAPLASPPGPKK